MFRKLLPVVIVLAIALTACDISYTSDPQVAPEPTATVAPAISTVPLPDEEISRIVNEQAANYGLVCYDSDLAVTASIAVPNKVALFTQCTRIENTDLHITIEKRVSVTLYYPTSTTFLAITNAGVFGREDSTTILDVNQVNLILAQIGLDPAQYAAQTVTVEFDLDQFTGQVSNLTVTY